jgi:hypothetical protein
MGDFAGLRSALPIYKLLSVLLETASPVKSCEARIPYIKFTIKTAICQQNLYFLHIKPERLVFC